ncbi:tetratricopeptide repeat protein [Acinetobacter gerneri]|uniref:Tetratricopeptide repeat protein n=1 Tax=Acinetobacter gerneri TaxID=202952 RepID=A0AAW8JI42_9GAMM|nr:tetratricopeptide repeat protein [Acinetobacter gerneri]MDQ9009206.1 tetratricopeptide repeat protein [Acinetobacter gerneri]MDQ9013310.1 tetratricopeptide repeat protein [Acinetobacter gerneri]MDQ9023473.1 tetratricopeptide repeat protein [Acinetobacter gerneri]MDQ9051982.1 tetratricopeptide repeat protein [Acinetobacter gerneri]MDQ9059365.1 tetratricopeptide repeat protein [Acinetobacter gerneri]
MKNKIILLSVFLFLNSFSNIYAVNCPENIEERTYQLIDGDIKLDIEQTKLCTKQGNMRAQKDLALAYASGRLGLEQDFKQSFEWNYKAALQGDAEAQTELGKDFENGFGIQQDEQKAMYWYTKASDQNYGRAQLYIGMLYAYGKGVERDTDKAIAWYYKAAENGNTSAQMFVETFGLNK